MKLASRRLAAVVGVISIVSILLVPVPALATHSCDASSTFPQYEVGGQTVRVAGQEVDVPLVQFSLYTSTEVGSVTTPVSIEQTPGGTAIVLLSSGQGSDVGLSACYAINGGARQTREITAPVPGASLCVLYVGDEAYEWGGAGNCLIAVVD